MADNNDVFRMLAAEDKLDGTNYPLWAYMMRHVLVAKGLWNIVQGVDVRPTVGRDAANAAETGDIEDVAGSSAAATVRAPPPTVEQSPNHNCICLVMLNKYRNCRTYLGIDKSQLFELDKTRLFLYFYMICMKILANRICSVYLP